MADTNSRAGERNVPGEVVEWLNKLHAPHDKALAQAFDAPADCGIPAIMVGASEGKLLTLLLQLIGAKRVVEVGALAGYSAIRMVKALPADGHLWSCEFDEKHAAIARANIHAAAEDRRISVLVGRASETLPTVESSGPFDAVFVDADKGSYDVYGRWAAKNVRKGGLLLVDNANFFGRLLEDSPEAAAVRRCHEEAVTAFDTVCIPTPDGLLLGVKR